GLGVDLSDQGAKQNELIDLSSLLSHLRLLETLDVWECTIDKTRSSTMKGMRSHIMNQSTVTVLTPFRWNRLLPIKVNILCWRIISLRLPRRLSLDYRGVDLDSVRCPICDNDIENEEHLFVHCDVSINTWARVLQWWSPKYNGISSISEVFKPTRRSKTYTLINFCYFDKWF
ncbi:RNA-directed DNA polymerase, eukaryota, reverse transcriptase zinc-binding domain protein, partial [Tanacetum coccineum]